jgi:hypothetical protein
MFSHTRSNRVYGGFLVTGNPNRSGLVPVLCMIGLNSWSSASQDEYEHQHRLRIIVSGTFYCGVLEVVSGQAHNLEVGGSNPSSATNMRVDCGKGRPAVFQTDNAEFDSPYPLQNVPASLDSATRTMRSALTSTGGPSQT